MKRLDGKVVMVFGAGSSGPGWGNGKAAAVAFAREGARVVAIDLDADAVAQTVGAIESEGYQALAVTADVTDSASVVAAVTRR